MRISFNFLLVSFFLGILPKLVTAQPLQTESDGWVDLFNGQNLDDWTVKIHHYDAGDNYGQTFRVENGVIQVRYDQYEGTFNDRFGHLYYDKPFGYYHLSLEYRFVGSLHPGAPSYTLLNSGIMFHAQDPQTMPREQNWPISVEMQFLAGIEAGQPRPTGNMCSPGTLVRYDGVMDSRHCINSTSDTYYGDQWVKAEIIVLGDSLITHLINGDTVLQYSDPTIGGNVVSGHLPEQKPEGKRLKEGFIALQSEGQPIDFRDIRIRELKGCMDPQATNFKPWFQVDDPNACTYR